MKIELITSITHAGESFGAGSIIDLPEADAHYHISAGSARVYRPAIKKKESRTRTEPWCAKHSDQSAMED